MLVAKQGCYGPAAWHLVRWDGMNFAAVQECLRSGAVEQVIVPGLKFVVAGADLS